MYVLSGSEADMYVLSGSEADMCVLSGSEARPPTSAIVNFILAQFLMVITMISFLICA